MEIWRTAPHGSEFFYVQDKRQPSAASSSFTPSNIGLACLVQTICIPRQQRCNNRGATELLQTCVSADNMFFDEKYSALKHLLPHSAREFGQLVEEFWRMLTEDEREASVIDLCCNQSLKFIECVTDPNLVTQLF